MQGGYLQDQHPPSGSQAEPRPATSARSSQSRSTGQTRSKRGRPTKAEAEKNLLLGQQASGFSTPTPSSSRANSRSARSARSAIPQSHQPEFLGSAPPSIPQMPAPHPTATSIYTPTLITRADAIELDIFLVRSLANGTLWDGRGILLFSHSNSKSVPMIAEVSHLRFSIS